LLPAGLEVLLSNAVSDWAKYSRDVLGDAPLRAVYRNCQFHATSLGYLLRFQPPPARVLSIGCNLGLFDALLLAHGYQVTSVDSDPEVLEMAETLSGRLGFGLHFEQADAFDLKQYHDRFDVAYSVGLVEHWHGRETVRLLKEHARCAPVVQVEVPSRWTWRIENLGPAANDMVTLSARKLGQRVREASLVPIKTYPLGSVPSRLREVSEALVPPVIFRSLQLLADLSMGSGIIARRPA
jgi:SAM-dependent methyltransferase